MGDRLTFGDLCVNEGHNLNRYRDTQADFYLQNHNLAAICHTVMMANRIFDSQQLCGQHTIASETGAVIQAIHQVIKSASIQKLAQLRPVFDRVFKIKTQADEDAER